MGVFGANLDKIAEIEPYPFVDINAEDAKEIGIEAVSYTHLDVYKRQLQD